ncbi:hypothetical protein F7230_07830 [Corynebacterium sp. 320]|uniref:hypothetical protein n=1 Tax=Corynebacterium TaxID=1716 RepID=UPI00125CCDE9|nr:MULTISPECIES: hypothetical protein [Corynebacterium]KAB1502889.1 hypothetical protein F7230_07830 [Corynebacterium sp. 320]KAB1552400.1 hypothetical protein F7233_01150 [Corynebacterium sp. 321]KAB1554385.1 hypothetical protein F7232_05445 [Corynebacterium sp. 319]KAB3526552.1 hypothetical protein F8354_07830 [Corynebacterium sp. 250]KAB3539872.1 hypothetical protein F8390_00885 [Corynebacterium sp. 366]
MLGPQLISEWKKATTSITWWAVGALIVTANVLVTSFFTFVGLNVERSPIDATAPDSVRMFLTVGVAFTFILPLILGMLIVNLEFYNNTIIYSFLGNQRRGSLYLAKLVTCAVSAMLFSVLFALMSLAVVAGLLSSSSKPATVFTGQTWGTLLSIVVISTLLGVIGGALGALVTKPMLAIVLIILWSQVIEPILRIASPTKAQGYLPSSLIDASLGGGFLGQMFNSEQLSQPLALGILAAVTVVLGILGGVKYAHQEV